jgi:hypothetical protein
MAGDWREAIRQYDADVASGVIVFGKDEDGKFACTYPGHDEGERQIAQWLADHICLDM